MTNPFFPPLLTWRDCVDAWVLSPYFGSRKLDEFADWGEKLRITLHLSTAPGAAQMKNRVKNTKQKITRDDAFKQQLLNEPKIKFILAHFHHYYTPVNRTSTTQFITQPFEQFYHPQPSQSE